MVSVVVGIPSFVTLGFVGVVGIFVVYSFFCNISFCWYFLFCNIAVVVGIPSFVTFVLILPEV